MYIAYSGALFFAYSGAMYIAYSGALFIAYSDAMFITLSGALSLDILVHCSLYIFSGALFIVHISTLGSGFLYIGINMMPWVPQKHILGGAPLASYRG